ncbi:MAG: helix-turn-helix domain-containing protein [Desulfobulbaceae bacterium]|nr:MAG: helix-turn-helix domain-containing protein [Desulfobulbaceae bacterium]
MPQFISEQEVAKITGRAVPTLRKDRHFQRGIPYFKFGRQVRYRIEDIEKFMAGCRVESNS